MSKRSIDSQIGIIVLSLVVLAIFNTNLRPGISEEQAQYNQWLASVEATSPNLPPVALRLWRTDDAAGPDWKLKSSSDAQLSEHILRLLQLVREAELFSKEKIAKPGFEQGFINLEIEGLERHFLARVPEAFIRSNIRAQNLLRLFQEYSSAASDRNLVQGPASGEEKTSL